MADKIITFINCCCFNGEMITSVLQYLRNWFCKTKYYGTFTIENGNINLTYDSGYDFSNINLLNGQYFRVIGSALNDGVWKYPAENMKAETFDGAIWALSVPEAVSDIADEVTEWQTKYGAGAQSPWQSESYSRGAYSRTRASGNEKAASWINAFEARLAQWRKL